MPVTHLRLSRRERREFEDNSRRPRLHLFDTFGAVPGNFLLTVDCF